MKVSELPYRRLTIEEIRTRMRAVSAAVRAAGSAAEVLEHRKTYLSLFSELITAKTLSYIRYSTHTDDPVWSAEKAYYDEVGPEAESLVLEYHDAILESPFRAELETVLPATLFRSYEAQKQSMSPEIIPELVEENRITTEYSDLMSGMEFTFRGKTMTRSELMKYGKDPDRTVRREAYTALGEELMRHRAQLDDIFDRLVRLRDKMAKKMGCRDFVELGYRRMLRICYDREMVEQLRANIRRDIVPAVARLRTENAKRMGLDRVMIYDEGVLIPGGDPIPSANPDDILNAGLEMYRRMNPEALEFYRMMLENGAFDVESRKHKWGGGYCANLPDFKQPFILANFNGTTGDVDVVTHEAGHAFNAWLGRDGDVALELDETGMETCETHSMSMEFFCWPQMELFFGDRADQYRYLHALDGFSFLPYGTMVDHFQHIVYEQPELTPAQRNAEWKKLEAIYRPYQSAEGIPYLEEGTRWQYQMHIYESPFYYIDYVIAQCAAFAFLLDSRKDYDEAFARYMTVMKDGMQTLYTDLLDRVNLPSPFLPGALAVLAEGVEALLEEIRP